MVIIIDYCFYYCFNKICWYWSNFQQMLLVILMMRIIFHVNISPFVYTVYMWRPISIIRNLYKIADIVLKCNYFEFRKDVYHQILGTAVAMKCVLHYTNIFMASLEEAIFEKFHFQTYVWLRYLDDIFVYGLKDLKTWKRFFGFLNNFHFSIQFTMGYSQK